MLKKSGLVVMSVAAGLVALAPIASAEGGSDHGTCSAGSDDKGNTGQLEECNVFGQHNGEGNTLNGMPFPSIPSIPAP